ncbi:Uncharacterized protein SCF082_LOCUS12475 [Durusdinium trenchii]|uniref:Uncharacterized protein n=1 Tax=Durusdinium trenchii TaxID=1381693 RepID=A0ABP0JKV8_9DINO
MKVVELTSDADVRLANPVHLLTEHDSFDVTVSPRAGAMGEWTKHLSMTPRQHDFRDRIQLPRLLRYPLPPDCLADEPEEKRRATLLKVFQDLSVFDICHHLAVAFMDALFINQYRGIEDVASQRFLMCMELLIRRAQARHCQHDWHSNDCYQWRNQRWNINWHHKAWQD